MALALGEPHPDYLKQKLTSRQISEWMAYERLEPFGPPARFFRAGVVASAVANSAAFRKKGARALTPADFLPESLKPAKKPLEKRILEAFGALGAKQRKRELSHGG